MKVELPRHLGGHALVSGEPLKGQQKVKLTKRGRGMTTQEGTIGVYLEHQRGIDFDDNYFYSAYHLHEHGAEIETVDDDED